MEAMLLNNRQSKLLQILKTKEGNFVSGSQLSSMLGVSIRTIRSDISFLNKDYLLDSYIESNNRLGYKIKGEMKAFRPKEYFDYKSRSFFIIQYLIESEDWFTYQEISEVIDVSSQTIRSDVMKISEFIKRSNFNITLETKPFKGIRLIGNEIDKRLLLARSASKHHSTNEELYHELETLFLNRFLEDDIYKIIEILKGCLEEHNVKVDQNTWSYLVINVLIQKYRSTTFVIPNDEFEISINNFPESALANSIVNHILNREKVTETETRYLTCMLMGLKILNLNGKNEKVELVDSFHMKVDKAIDFISKKYGYNLLADKEFKNNLTQHLDKVIFPIKYRMEIRNPFLEKIKFQYIQAYQMAIVFSEYLGNSLMQHIPENEIGYIALHIEAAIERQDDLSLKIAILSSNSDIIITLIKQKIKKNFPQVKIIGYFSLETIKDIPDEVNVVISTIPVKVEGKNTIVVNDFLQSSDIFHIKKSITFGKLKEYVKKEHFVYLDEESKKSFLKKMTEKLGLEKYLNGILDRESLASTDIGGKIALPRPLFSAEEDSSSVYVGVNKNSLCWGDSKVNLVFLLILSERDKIHYEYIYREVYQLIRYESKVIQLSQVEDYESFKKLL